MGMLVEQAAQSETDFVFPIVFNLNRHFRRILKAAGIPRIDRLGRKLTAHSFRHTYATLMADMEPLLSSE